MPSLVSNREWGWRIRGGSATITPLMNYPGHVPMDTNGHTTPQQNNFMAGKHDRLANDSTFKTIAF